MDLNVYDYMCKICNYFHMSIANYQIDTKCLSGFTVTHPNNVYGKRVLSSDLTQVISNRRLITCVKNSDFLTDFVLFSQF